MSNIKIEYDLRLEVLFISITKDNIILYKELENSNILEQAELTNIRKMEYLLNSLGNIPSVETLKHEFPDMFFENAEPIKEDQLNDFISLFITKRKNKKASLDLLSIAQEIDNSGLSNDVVDKINRITTSETVQNDFVNIFDTIEHDYEESSKVKGISTQVKYIDEISGGLQIGSLTTLMGFTGSFKTTWALNITYGALKDGFNTLYLSLEVPASHILFDLISRHSFEKAMKVEHRSIKQKKLKDDEKEKVFKEYLPEIQQFPGKLYVVDEQLLDNYSVFSLENKFREVDKRCQEDTGRGIDFVIIDHAQLLKFSSTMKAAGLETSIINQYVSFFRQQALNFIKEHRQVAMLVLSQTSRGGYQEACKNDGRYRLTALAEANELERASSLVLSAFSSVSLAQIQEAKVQVLKSRDGSMMAEPISVYANPVYYAFGDIDSVGNIDSQPLEMPDLSELFSDQETIDNLFSAQNAVTIENIDLGI